MQFQQTRPHRVCAHTYWQGATLNIHFRSWLLFTRDYTLGKKTVDGCMRYDDKGSRGKLAQVANRAS